MVSSAAGFVVRGVHGMFLHPSSREWLGWLVPFAVAGVWQYRAKKPGASLREALAWTFPKRAYFSASFLQDLGCIAARLVFARVVLGLLLRVRYDEDAIAGALASAWGASAALKTGLLPDLAFSAAVFLSFELGWYAAHRATHEVPLLWAFHKVHHNATVMNPLTARRFHFLDDLLTTVTVGLTGGVVLFAFRALGYAPSRVLVWGGIPLFALGLLAFGALRHSHVPLSFGRLERWLSSPVMHQVHHSWKAEHRNKNYGYYLTVFDALGGSLYRPVPGEELPFGLSQAEAAAPDPGFLRMYFLQPLADAAAYARAGTLWSWKGAQRSAPAGAAAE